MIVQSNLGKRPLIFEARQFFVPKDMKQPRFGSMPFPARHATDVASGQGIEASSLTPFTVTDSVGAELWVGSSDSTQS
jgi:hypothetical protein